MIVCHCKNITNHDIYAAVDRIKRAEPNASVTAGKIYRTLGKVADCGGCVPLFISEMRQNRTPLPN